MCMTCCLCPLCCQWMKRSIRWHEKSLICQISVSMCVALLFLFGVLIGVIAINEYILMTNTFNKLDENISTMYVSNLVDLGKEATITVDLYRNISAKTIEKTNLILSELLDVTNTRDYPLDYSKSALLYRFAEVPATDTQTDSAYGSNPLTWNHMTFESASASLQQSTQTILRKIKTLEAAWKKVRNQL